MKERPMLFKDEMIRAILEGRKTQTRRLVKPQPETMRDHFPTTPETMMADGYSCNSVFKITERPGIYRCLGMRNFVEEFSPYGQPGDRLWVREKWRIGAWRENTGCFAIDYCDGPLREWRNDPTDHDGEGFTKLWIQCSDELHAKGIEPDADGHYRWEVGESPLRWRPSIHMPRWASRISLEITGVRVERLQDISEADAKAEGVKYHSDMYGYLLYGNYAGMGPVDGVGPIKSFVSLWETINGHGSWDANPWVWVVEFKVV